jgi:hypothetical protein
MAENEGKSFMQRLGEATANVVQSTRDGVETLQTKHGITQTYNEVGRKAAELVDKGEVTHPELVKMVAQIHELKDGLDDGPTAPPPAEPEG